jgi:hypothetical protein
MYRSFPQKRSLMQERPFAQGLSLYSSFSQYQYFAQNRSRALFVVVASLLSYIAALALPPMQLHGQTPGQTRQYQMAVARANSEPFKVDVQPEQQTVSPGTTTRVKIELRNASNEPVNTSAPVKLVLKATSPSQTDQVQTVWIQANTSSAPAFLRPHENGLWKLEVYEPNQHLKSGSNVIMVSAAPSPTPQSQRRTRSRSPRDANPPGRSPQGIMRLQPRLVMAAYILPPEPEPQPTPLPQPEIILAVSGEGDGKIRADGVSAAQLTIFLLAPQTSPVRVVLDVSHGQLDQPVVIIPAGQTDAKVKWTSSTPATQAKVSIRQTVPNLTGQQQVSATADFVDPIVAIAFENPLSRMNIVERATVAVRFVDKNANPIPAHIPVRYRFSVDSAHLNLVPAADQTRPDSMDFTTDITSSALGSVKLEAAVQGLPPIQQPIEITGMMLLGLCVGGGALGGLVNHFDRKQKGLWASLLIAAIVSLPVTWLYVCVGLPKANAAFLHSQLSAIMVAIIGGVAGASGLKAVAGLAGMQLFQSAPDTGGQQPPQAKGATSQP